MNKKFVIEKHDGTGLTADVESKGVVIEITEIQAIEESYGPITTEIKLDSGQVEALSKWLREFAK